MPRPPALRALRHHPWFAAPPQTTASRPSSPPPTSGLEPTGSASSSPPTKGFILAPEAQVSLRFDGADASADHEAVAENHVWPLGIRGLFTTDLTFDKPGPWSVDIAFEDADGSIKRAALAFDVPQQPNAPSPGDPAIASATRTLGDGGSVASLTTGSFQDPGFYRIPLAQAITNGRPTVFVVASPAFCTNATCGPILETLHEVQGEYQDRVNFVHADFFDNPGDIQDDLSNARVSPVAEEWGVSNAEWTFVIDGRGVVSPQIRGLRHLRRA